MVPDEALLPVHAGRYTRSRAPRDEVSTHRAAGARLAAGPYSGPKVQAACHRLERAFGHAERMGGRIRLTSRSSCIPWGTPQGASISAGCYQGTAGRQRGWLEIDLWQLKCAVLVVF